MAGTNLGKAYVQIIPSADGIKKQLEDVLGKNMPNGEKSGKKIGATLASGFGSAVKGIGSVMKSTLVTAAKVGTAAMSAAAVGVGALVKQSAEAYAAYEQNVGGVETLFKDNSDAVVKYANDAYKTAGVSANAYMENVTSFSASLLQGLGGDTAQAAEVANTAMVDMSDNANKFGTDISSIQNAYQGFAKNNYTMLDNLKLGYGGTQEEMARLINDSGVLGDTVEVTASTVNDVSFDKMIEAIHTVQDEMGITGTTSLEAGTTVSGSMGMVSAAWENLMAGMADKDADLGGLIDNLVDSLSGAGENLLPVVEQALNGVVSLISELAPQIVAKIPELINAILPNLLTASAQIVGALATALPQIITTFITAIKEQFPSIVKAIVDILPLLNEGVTQLITAVIELLPTLIPALVEGACTLFTGIIDSLNLIVEKLMPMLPDMIDKIVNVLIENMPTLIDGAINLFLGIVTGIANALPQILQSVFKLVASIVSEIGENLTTIVTAGIDIVIALATGLPQAIPALVAAIPQIITSIIGALFVQDWGEIGGNILQGLLDGLVAGISSIGSVIADVADSIYDGFCDFFGIHSPSRLFRDKIGVNLAKGIEVGFDDEIPDVNAEMNRTLKSTISTDYTPAVANAESVTANQQNGGIITLVLADNAYNILAKGMASPLDLINGGAVTLTGRGLVTI